MIEDSVFTNNKIKEIIKRKYNIDVYSIKKLNRGSANIYSLNNDKYILKEFQSKYTMNEINKEIKIINHLKKDKIPVPTYIKTINNKYCFTYKKKIIILQKYIDGYTMDSNTGNKEQLLESSKYLGKIIKSLNGSKIRLKTTNIHEWYSTDALNEGIEKHKKLLNIISKDKNIQIYNDLTDKIKMLEYVRDNMDFHNMSKITIMKTHGDYSVLQFIYKNNKINAIIDFVSACKMPIIWELIRSYSYIDKNAKDGKIDINNYVEYIKEFNKYVHLNKYDYQYMPYLYMVQLLTSTFGYKQYILDNTKNDLLEFALFRTKLCKYLFDNADTISKILQDNFCYN